MGRFWNAVWLDETGQDIAEYAVMLGGHPSSCRGLDPIDWLECQQRFFASWKHDSLIQWNLSNFRLRLEKQPCYAEGR